MEGLVDGAWLADNLQRPDVRIVDCRFKLADPEFGRTAYREGHIPGAVFLDMKDDLSGPEGPGRHPLPTPDAFEASARRAGIGPDTLVVAYDQGMVGGGARLWWLLRHFGHRQVVVLDGGLGAWTGPLEAGEQTVPAGGFSAEPQAGDTVDAEDLRSRLDSPGLRLLDAREAARFRGETEPMDATAGHIPGAVNVPAAVALADRDALLQHVNGHEELVAYCGSGVTACLVLLALDVAGHRGGKLYPGSWSDWSRQGLPVARGAGPDRIPPRDPEIVRHDVGPLMSQLVVHDGVAYLAGQVARDGSTDVRGQTKAILGQIDALLAQAETHRRNLLSVNIFLSDIEQWQEMNEVWSAWITPGRAPVRVTAEARLAAPKYLVEMAATAAVPERS